MTQVQRFQDFPVVTQHGQGRVIDSVHLPPDWVYFLMLCIVQVNSKVIFSYNIQCFPGEEKRGQVWQFLPSHSSKALQTAFWLEQLANSCYVCSIGFVNFNLSLGTYCVSGTVLSVLSCSNNKEITVIIPILQMRRLRLLEVK